MIRLASSAAAAALWLAAALNVTVTGMGVACVGSGATLVIVTLGGEYPGIAAKLATSVRSTL